MHFPLILALTRAIVFEVVVDAPPSQVYEMWTTPAGVERFFAPKAVIDPRPGGEYTIVFAPDVDPEGRSYGTKGARVLTANPPRELSFEWVSFTADDTVVAGVPGPPSLPRAERDVSPLPTYVVLTFEPAGKDRTRVRLEHRGFGRGGKWDESHAFFTRAWSAVLEELKKSARH